MPEHTPGPLMLHDMEFATVVTKEKPGQFVALCEARALSAEESLANANRVIASWNACAGIPTEALKDSVVSRLGPRRA